MGTAEGQCSVYEGPFVEEHGFGLRADNAHFCKSYFKSMHWIERRFPTLLKEARAPPIRSQFRKSELFYSSRSFERRIP